MLLGLLWLNGYLLDGQCLDILHLNRLLLNLSSNLTLNSSGLSLVGYKSSVVSLEASHNAAAAT